MHRGRGPQLRRAGQYLAAQSAAWEALCVPARVAALSSRLLYLRRVVAIPGARDSCGRGMQEKTSHSPTSPASRENGSERQVLPFDLGTGFDP